MFAEHWAVGVDTGDSIDDIIEFHGSELSTLLTHLVDEPNTLPRRQPPPSQEAEEDFLLFLDLLSRCRAQVSAAGLNVGYIPRTTVSPGIP